MGPSRAVAPASNVVLRVRLALELRVISVLFVPMGVLRVLAVLVLGVVLALIRLVFVRVLVEEGW